MLHYRKCKYQLVESMSVQTRLRPKWPVWTRMIELTPDGILSIDKGWVWDGPSGPTIDTKDTMVAAAVHDALYELMAKGVLSEEFRRLVDIELYVQLVANGMPSFRAWAWYRAVRIFGDDYLGKGEETFIISCRDHS